VHTYQWIEQQQGRTKSVQCGNQTIAVVIAIESKSRRINESDIEGLQIDTPVCAKVFYAGPYFGKGIFGEVDEGRSLTAYPKSPKARSSGCNTYSHIQPKPALRTFGGTSDNSNALTTPKILYQPDLVGLPWSDLGNAKGRESRCTRFD
jgi:hypothetical protein